MCTGSRLSANLIAVYLKEATSPHLFRRIVSTNAMMDLWAAALRNTRTHHAHAPTFYCA